MFTEERRDNGPRPDVAPVYEKTTKSKKSFVLPFLAGLLVAGLVFGAFAVGGAHGRANSGTTAHSFAGLTPVVDYLRFAPEDVTAIAVTTRNGSVEVRLHNENYIAVHGSNSVSHEISGGALSVESRNGSFTVFLPEAGNILNTLTADSRNGRVLISGEAGGNTVLARNLQAESRNGSITLSDLAVPGSLDAETRNGSVNVSNVLSDDSNTRLYTRNGRINAN